MQPWSQPLLWKGPAAGGVSSTYASSASQNATVNPVTAAAMPIGAPSADRLVVVCIADIRSTAQPRTISSATIGGIAATIHAQIGNSSGTTGPVLGIISALVPTGTTADVVITRSGLTQTIVISVYTLTGYVSATPTGTNTVAVASGDPSTTINVTGPGVAIGIWCGSSGTTATTIWTGLSTKDYDAVVAAVTNTEASSAHQSGLSTETPRTISATSTMTAETIVTASWH